MEGAIKMSETNFGQHGNEGPEHEKKLTLLLRMHGRQTNKPPAKGFRLLTGDACIMTGVCGWAWYSCLRR